MDDPKAFLNTCIQDQSQGVRHYRFNGFKVWVKKAMPRHGAWKYWPLSFLSLMTGVSMLKPVPNFGGEQAIHTEIQRLESLRKAGVRVPEVLATADNGFMMRDMGSDERPAQSLVKAMKHAGSAEDCLFWMQKGAEALVAVHSKGCWLSEAFGRNILIDAEGEIAFIDFEVDPVKLLTFVDCCARDWMTFTYSCIMCLEKHGCLSQGQSLIHSVFAQESLQIQLNMLEQISKVSWIRRLPIHRLDRGSRSLYWALTMLGSLTLSQ